MLGSIKHIFICADKGEPMNEVIEVLAKKGIGLNGDRYALGKGAYPTGLNHVTFIALKAIEEANAALQEPFSPGETRRNIVVEGIECDDLNDLVGKEFSIGDARFLGVKLCHPCTRPAIVVGRGSEQGKKFEAAFSNQGGLNAEVLETGILRVGHAITFD